MTQALYRKWRPQSFDDVVGQEHVITTLRNQITLNRVGHAYLFAGSRGCGKTTTARILAREINLAGSDPADPQFARIAEAIAEGRAMDVIEFDAATHTQVEKIREVLDRVSFQPSELRYKVYIIDEVHMLSTSAFNALLKTLEEPPPHVVFILATTDPQKIPATVLSRCQRFNFKRVPVRLMVERLRKLCHEEGIEADDHALTLIARAATGSLRDGISLLDQLASSSSMRITADDVREALGVTDAGAVRALAQGLAGRDAPAGLDAIQDAVDQGADARQVARQMVEYLRAALQAKLVKQGAAAGDLSEAERLDLAGFAEQLSAGALLGGIRAFSTAIYEMRPGADTQLALEMAFLECITAPTSTSTSTSTDAPRSTVAPAAKARGREAPPASPVAPVTESAPAAAATPAPAPGPAEPPAGGVEALRGVWKQLIQDVNANNKAAAALLRSCHPHAVVGDVVRFQADHDLIRVRLEDAKNKASVVAALNRLLNGKYTLQVFTAQSAEPPPEDDPVLKAATKLGGRVRE